MLLLISLNYELKWGRGYLFKIKWSVYEARGHVYAERDDVNIFFQSHVYSVTDHFALTMFRA